MEGHDQTNFFRALCAGSVPPQFRSGSVPHFQIRSGVTKLQPQRERETCQNCQTTSRRCCCSLILKVPATNEIAPWASVREYLFNVFSDFEKREPYAFLNDVAYQKNREKLLRHQSVKISSYTSLSDHCNSIPELPRCDPF